MKMKVLGLFLALGVLSVATPAQASYTCRACNTGGACYTSSSSSTSWARHFALQLCSGRCYIDTCWEN